MLRMLINLSIRCFLFFFLVGCTPLTGNVGNLPIYSIPTVETDWIRKGEPIEFEEELWYPQDSVEILTDSEVYLLGEFKGVQFFVERVDVRPYDRVYTKFGRNKYRIFEKKFY